MKIRCTDVLTEIRWQQHTWSVSTDDWRW